MKENTKPILTANKSILPQVSWNLGSLFEPEYKRVKGSNKQ